MIRAVIFGESHTVCLAQALPAGLERLGGISIHRFAGKRSFAGDGAISMNEAVALIEHLPPTVPVFLSIMGGYHNLMGLVRQEPNFDFVLKPDAAMADLDFATVVPCRAIADALDFYIQPSSKYLPIRKAASGPVYLIGTPPPKEQDDFILGRFAQANKQNYRGQNVLEIGLNSARLRLKFWELERERSEHWARAHDIAYLGPPPEAFDANSFLAERYYEDATHANKDYGALVLEQILAIATNIHEDAAHG